MTERTVLRAGRLPDDVESCVRLWLRVLAARDGRVDGPAVRERAEQMFRQPIMRFAVVAPPDRGFALTVHEQVSGATGERIGERSALLQLLAAETPGRGVGGALLVDAIEHAGRAGFEHLLLRVRRGNARAIALYERHGFAPLPGAERRPTSPDAFITYRRPVSAEVRVLRPGARTSG